MKFLPLRWIAANISNLILAVFLAVVVWISAVVTADPNEERTSQPIPIEIIGQNTNLLLVEDIPTHTRLTLNAPVSIWQQLENDPDLIRAWIDLSGLRPGEHVVPVKTQINISPYRFVSIQPKEITVVLDALVVRDFPVTVTITGDPPLGYRKDEPLIEPSEITISGPENLVSQVERVHANLDISGSVETVKKNITVEVLNKNGNSISDLDMSSKIISITQPISRLGGFKNVAVKVVSQGQVANGYRLTNITVSPPNLTLFSDDLRIIDEIPGFVETLPVDITDLTDDVEISTGLDLPPGVTSVQEPNVLVQVSVAAIEGSLTLALPIQVVGLSPELEVIISPNLIDVIVAGPLNLLDTLSAEDISVIIDLEDLPAGVYQRSPIVEVFIDRVRVQTTLPETVEVVIEQAPTPTPTPTESVTPTEENTITPTPTGTPTEMPPSIVTPVNLPTNTTQS
jgi:YbbR domain-containing protein